MKKKRSERVVEMGARGCSSEVPPGPVGRAEPLDSVGTQPHTFTQQVLILATRNEKPWFPGHPNLVNKNMRQK